MADLSTITLPNNVTYNFKDASVDDKIKYVTPRIGSFSGEGDSSAYCLVCTMVISATYINGPIEITLQERGRNTIDRLQIMFASANSVDPGLGAFYVIGRFNDYYLYKSATSTWQLYARKNENWSRIDVINCAEYAGVTYTWNLANATLPSSGTTRASYAFATSDTNNAVTQTATTTSADYEVLFSATADNTTRTEGARKNNNLLFNPSTGNLKATQLNGVTIGSNPKFTDTNTTYTANTSKLVTTTVPNVTSIGSAPTLGTAIPADDITAWTTNTATTPVAVSVSGGGLNLTSGSKGTSASLSYTAKSIPNVTSVGSAPTLGTAITVATGSTSSSGSGATVATGITAS